VYVPAPAEVTVGLAVFEPVTATARRPLSSVAVRTFPLASRTVMVSVVALPAVPAGTLASVWPASAAPTVTVRVPVL